MVVTQVTQTSNCKLGRCKALYNRRNDVRAVGSASGVQAIDSIALR